MQAVFKGSSSTIPTICIENSSCNEPSARNSPICDVSPQFLIASNEEFLGKSLSFNVQVSQFLCWFSELTEPRKLLFTALVVKNTSPDFLQIAHTLLAHRLLAFQSPELVRKANSVDKLKNLFSISDPSELSQTLLHLLSHLSTEPSSVLSGNANKDDNNSDQPVTVILEQGTDYNETVRRYYLDLIDKVFENLSSLRTNKCSRFAQQQILLDDAIDTNEGQILLLAMSHPVFDSKDKQWLLSRLIHYRDLSKQPTDEEIRGGEILKSLTTLAADFIDILVEPSNPGSPKKYARKPNSSSQFPFFTRSLMSYMNRRHHSLVPRSQAEELTYLDAYKCGSSLCVPLIAQPSPLSNSSLNSSGFISGSESMHQGLSQLGLNEPHPTTASCSFHSTPQNTSFRLHPPSSLLPFNPFRRQSASPYASHCTESQLKEGDEELKFREPHASSPSHRAEPANTDGSESSEASQNIPCLVGAHLPRENEQPSSSVDVHHVELSQTSFAIVSDRFQKTSFEAPIISPPNFCSARPPSSPTLPSPSDSIDLQSTPGGSAQPNPCNSTNLPSPAPFYALKLSSGASDSETSLWSPLPSPKPSVFTEVTGRSEPNSLNFNTSPEIKEAPLAGSKMFSEDDSGMECLPLWLKSLRLHKYVGLFQRLSYREMFGITDEWLQRHHVTQGARNKILVSINKLSSRSATLKRLEHEMAGCIGSADQVPTLRGFLAELRSILQTPIARFMGGMTAMTPVSTSMLASVSEGKALHGTHPPTSSPEPSISLVVAEGTAPSTDDVDVEEEEEEEEEDEDNFGNEVSEEDEFGDEEDNPEISDQQDFLGEAFHRPSRPRLLHRERKFAIYSDDIGSGDGVLSRISFNNSDTCLHQPKFPSEGLERTCLRPATSILRRKSSEDVFFFEHHAPARRNSELSIGRTRRPYKQRCHKPTDSTVGAAIDCNSRLIQLATADRRKAQSEPKHLLLETAEMNTSAIPSEPENLPEQIIRCLFQGFTALLNGAKGDQDNYASFVQLLTVVLDHSSFTKEQKSLASEWQMKLVDALGPAPLRRSYRNTRPSRRPTQYHPSFRSSFYGVRQPTFSLPYMPRPQYRLHSLPLPGAGYPSHHSLSPIRLGPNGYPDSADPRPRPGALSPTCALINSSVVGTPSFTDLQPVFHQQTSPYERDQKSKVVDTFAPIPSFIKTPTSSSRSWSTLSAHEDQRQFDYIHPYLTPGPRLSPLRAGFGASDESGLGAENSDRCTFRSWNSIQNPEFSVPSSSRHHPPSRPLGITTTTAVAGGQAAYLLSVHRGQSGFGKPAAISDVPSEGLATAEPSPVFQSQGGTMESPFTPGYCKGFPTCRGPMVQEGVMAARPVHPPRQQMPSQFSIHGQTLTHQSSDEISEITSNLTKASLVAMLLETPSTNAPLGVRVPTAQPSLAYVGCQVNEFSSRSTLGGLELSKMDFPSVHCTSTAEINRNLDLLTQKVTKLAIDESDSPSE